MADLPTSALLEALLADAGVGLAFWDRSLRYQRLNAEVAAMTGRSAEDHLGRRPTDVLPEVGARLERILERVLRTGEPLRDVEVAGAVLPATGGERDWRVDFFPVREAGAIVGVGALVVEVTNERPVRRDAETARQRVASVESELGALYAALPVGVAFLSPDLRFQRVNETLARMNERPAAGHVGATLHEVMGPAATSMIEALGHVAATRKPLEIEVTVPRRTEPSVLRTLEATYFPVTDSGGALLGLGGVVRDVTDRRALELHESELLRDAVLARDKAEAAEVRADDAREEAQRAGVRMALLARAGREMAGSMDWEATLRAVTRSVVPDFADVATLTVVDPGGRLRVAAIAHVDPARERIVREIAERWPEPVDAPAGPANVIRTGRMEVLADLTPEIVAGAARDPEHLRLLRELAPRHVTIAPLRTPGGVIGALSLIISEGERRFSADDLQLIMSIAARAALQIQNARLYAESSSIARTLQASLRPRALPAIPGADIAARFRAAGDQNEVGGDFYDVFRSGDDQWTAVVGDVSGKGPEAAAITSLARHTLRAAARLHHDPAANLALLNDALHEYSVTTEFCTVFYAEISPSATGFDLRFSNGGHPAPFVLRAGGTVESVDGGRGPLVGALPSPRFGEARLALAPGDLLLLYTDGVTEVRTDDMSLGEHELRATLADHAGACAAEVVAAVEARAVELQAREPRDDIAVLAFKAIGGGG